MSAKPKFSKKIGLFGGVGPWASKYAYEEIVRLAQWDYGAVQDEEYPSILHVSEPITGFGAKGVEANGAILDQMKKTFDLFQTWGADIAIIACNSLHRYYNELAKQYSPMHIISLPREGAKQAQTLGLQKVAVLCSSSAREDGLHRSELDKHGITTLEANDEQQACCDHMIETVMAGDETSKTYGNFRSLTKEFSERGAQGIIAGCTELSYLAVQAHPSLPVIDCLKSAVETTLKLAATPQ